MLVQVNNRDNRYLSGTGRWQKVHTLYNPTPRHRLYDYCVDGYGYHSYSNLFNPAEHGEAFIDYIVVNGEMIAFDRFISCGSVWGYNDPEHWTEKDGEHYISAYDIDGNIFNPMLLEYDEYGERVRVWWIV